jgi:hypothetical protein
MYPLLRYIVRSTSALARPLIVWAAFSYGTANAEQPQTQPVVLWQGLAMGMLPEEALPVVTALEGVKSAKVRGNSDASERLQIRYTGQKITIANIPFELSPRFVRNKLKEVWLTAPDQCGAKAIEVFQKLATGLATKYPQRLGEVQDLSALDVSRANARALESGKPEMMAFAFTSDTVAAALIFQFEVAAPPSYPVNGGKLGASFWRLAQSMYDQRRSECDGTGDRRMGLALRYLARSDLEGLAEQAREKQSAEQAATADKL